MNNIIDKIRVSGTDYTLSATSSGGNPTVELTQAEYDALVSAGTVSADTYYIITDAQAGDLTQYWTSAQTQSAITQATSGKVDTTTFNAYSGSVETAINSKLDATAYTPTVVDAALSQSSTNPVQNQALYSELRISNGGETETTLFIESNHSTNYPSGCTKLKVEVVGSNNYSNINFFNANQNLGTINIFNYGSISVDNSYFQAATYEISGTTVIFSYPTVTNVTKIGTSGDGNHIYKAVTTEPPTVLKDQVVANTTALANKQDTLIAGTNITISGNVISAEGGGGKAVTGGTNISVTTGETADTINCTLPITAGTGTNSLILGYTNSDSYWRSQATGKGSIASGVRCFAKSSSSIAVGYNNTASGGAGVEGNFAQGYMTTASGNRCHSEGLSTSATSDASHSEGHNTTASGNYSHSEGEGVKATNVAEHSQGRFNASNKANTTWGDSGNTLFSVGNGTADNARHNAFEIRQNGDIYITSGNTDIKLQDNLGGGGGGGTVDQSFDRDSENAISNKVVSRGTIGSYGLSTEGSGANVRNILQVYDQGGYGVSKLSIPYTRINNKPVIANYADKAVVPYNIDVVETSAITTSISSSSTDAQVPSAKCLYDAIGDIETLLSQI